MAGDLRLADCLKRVSEAEKNLALTREVLTQICSESGTSSRASPSPPAAVPPAPPKAAAPVSDDAGAAGLGRVQAGGKEEIELSPEDHARCRDVFNSADQDGSGFINQREVKDLLQKMTGKEVSEDELQAMMVEMDENYDGKVSLEEFERAFFYTQEQKEAHMRNEMYELGKESVALMDGSVEEIVKNTGVKQKAVLRYLRKELDENSACLALPQAMMIFILFAIAVMLHFNMEILFGMDHSITWDIQENSNFAFSGITPFENGRIGHKGLEDVNSIADFWSWMTLGITPLFFPTGWDTNEIRGNVAAQCQSVKSAFESVGWDATLIKDAATTSGIGALKCDKVQETVTLPTDVQDFFGQASVDGRYLIYNTIIGGVRMRQERSKLVDCPDEDMRKLYKGRCIERSRYWLKPELYELGLDEELADEVNGEDVYLLVGETQIEVRRQLNNLENAGWFSPLTNKIEILFTTYNPKEDLVTAVYVSLFHSPGGHLHKQIEPVSFYVSPYNSWVKIFFDIAWLLLVLKLLIEETIELGKHWRQLGFSKGTQTYLSIANAVDWLSIMYALVLVIYWSIHLANLKKVRDIMEKGSADVKGTWSADSDRKEFFNLAHDAVHQTHVMRTLLAVYPFIILSRFFKAFSYQPRLALVTQTISKASVDIFHFLVVFGLVMLIFAFSAHVLWGQETDEHAVLARSIHTTLRFLNGDYDWDDLHGVGRIQAYMWFWCFVWFMAVIMLNMLVAIVLDIYTEVKGGIGSDAETLWSQSLEIVNRWQAVRKGRALSLSKILQKLDPTSLDSDDGSVEDGGVLFIDTFCAEVPGLSEAQSEEILVASQKLEIAEARRGFSLTDSAINIEKINVRVKSMQELLRKFVAMQTAQQNAERGRATTSETATPKPATLSEVNPKIQAIKI